MATPNDPVPLTVRTRLIWGEAGAIWGQNVLHFLNPTGQVVSQTLVNSVGATIKALYTQSTWDSHVAPAVGLRNVTMRDISTGESSEFVENGALVPGIGTGEVLPPSVAFVVTLRTAKAGKSFRGRVYLGFIDEVSSVNGAPAVGVGSSAAGFLELIRTNVNSTHQLQLAVVTRWNKKTLRVPPQANEVLACVASDNRFDSQRRRLGPGGTASTLSSLRFIAEFPQNGSAPTKGLTLPEPAPVA